MRFFIDAQLPQILVTQLTELGHDAVHVKTLPRAGDTSDAEITSFADANNRIVVTKDNDFRHTHETGGHPNRLLFITVGNLRNRELLTHVTTHHGAILDAFERSDFVELGEHGLTLHLRPFRPTDG